MSQADMPWRKTSARRRAHAARAGRLAASDGRNGSLNREDWLNAALVVLNEEGVNGIKVLPLSKRLGVTRGSFYWHFEDRDELLRGVLRHWDEELTDTVIANAKVLDATPREKMESVMTDVLFNHREAYDRAIAAWGAFDQEATKAYKRVIRKRFRFLASVLSDAGISKSDAEFRARLILGFLSSEIEHQPRRSRAKQLADLKRLCDIVFA
jgi:AcrR family transcriptional regulator